MKITEVFETGSLREDAYLYVAQKELQEDGSYKESFRRIPLATFLGNFAKDKTLRARYLATGYRDNDNVDHGVVFEPGSNFEHPDGYDCALVCLLGLEGDEPVVLRNIADGVVPNDAVTVGQFEKIRKIINEIDQDFNVRVLPVVDAAVTVEKQTFTDDQKSQARNNIGAMGLIADKDLDMNGKGIVHLNDLQIKGIEKNYVLLASNGIFKEYDGTPHAILNFDDDAGLGVVLRCIYPGVEPGDAATVGQVKEVDLTTKQTWTEEQQAQARDNIGASKGNENRVSLTTADRKAEIYINATYALVNDEGNMVGAIVEFNESDNDLPVVLRNIGTCKENTDAANKGYVDNAIANAIANLPVYNGEVEEV